MYCNEVSFQELLDCSDNDLENTFENNAWKMEHNAEQLQEILNRIIGVSLRELHNMRSTVKSVFLQLLACLIRHPLYG